MATASTSSNTSAARSAADGNELLDLRDAEAASTTPPLQTTTTMVILHPSELSLLTPQEAMASVKPWRSSHPLVS